MTAILIAFVYVIYGIATYRILEVACHAGESEKPIKSIKYFVVGLWPAFIIIFAFNSK